LDKQPITDLTLRDYFAAKAMQSLMSIESNTNMHYIVHDSYEIADLMIKERNKDD